MLKPGTCIGPYEVVSSLGAGGMGEVYRAHDPRLEREVALKVLPAKTLADETARARMVREARLAAKLNHPNICTIHEVGEDQGQVYIAMELVEGKPLDAVLAGGALPTEQAVRYASQVADALAHAHARGVVHRDLKSANVVITPEGRAKVLDFGLAKRLAGEELHEVTTQLGASLTEPGAVVGTLPYMAPEQLHGHAADARSDVWALGVVLYEMLSGRRPFQGDTGFVLSSAILKEAPAALPTTVPARLAAVIGRCLVKEPGDRYQLAGDVREALETAGCIPSGGRRAPARAAAPRRRVTSRKRIRALVVLPLLNLSRDPEQEYFADGMTEALIADLAKIQALRIISRTSAMRYKETKKSLPEIAVELSVDAVVEGSVLRAGQRVRITAQLIHAATDTHLWAESYERDLEDVLLLQSEVARAIASEIRVAVTPEETRRLAAARPVNAEAYDACLKGRFHWHRLSREHLDTALHYFQLALEKDPSCARAWAGITATWSSLTDAGFVPPHEAIPKAKAAALKALELDDSLAEARVNLANLIFYGDWNWGGAETEFRRAIELDPNSADAHIFLADFLISMGRAEEAATESQRALELDPFSFFIQCFFGWHLVYLGRYDDAIAQLRKTLQMEPDFSSAHLGLWGAFYRKGTLEDALAEARRLFEVLGDGEIAAALEQGDGHSGYSGAMSVAAARLVERAARTHVPAVRIARLWAHAGETGHALDWLEKALTWHESPLVHLLVGWDWDTLRPDPRYQDLLRRMNLPLD